MKLKNRVQKAQSFSHQPIMSTINEKMNEKKIEEKKRKKEREIKHFSDVSK